MQYAVITRNGLYRANIDRDELNAMLDCSADECDRAIHEVDGWCGTFIDVEPVVVVADDDFQHGLPEKANAYLGTED